MKRWSKYMCAVLTGMCIILVLTFYNRYTLKSNGYLQTYFFTKTSQDTVNKLETAIVKKTAENIVSDTGTTTSLTSIKPPTFPLDESKKSIFDIMNTKPIQFLPYFKNPCWYGSKTNGPINDNKLHCLPYFYLIGIKKSGTSNLFARISAHPDVVYGGFKESQWFSRRRFGMTRLKTLSDELTEILKTKDVRRLEYYVSMFDVAAERIAERPSAAKNNNKYHNCITGEGTPANLHMNINWDLLPGNEGLSEPRYTILHYIKHLVPDAKILIIFRDPVDRLLSDYLHTNRRNKIHNLSPDTLHERVKYEVDTYRKCFQNYSMRRCIYDTSFHNYTHVMGRNIGGFAFNVSFYAFYMKELLSVFPKDQIIPILMLDYIQDTERTMAKIFDFLGLSKLSTKVMHRKILNRFTKNKSKLSKFGEMREDTKQLLREFFRPSNEEMAKIMNDSRYLFEPVN